LETGNYKYFAGVCRGFLGNEKEKKIEGDGAEKMLRFSTEEEKAGSSRDKAALRNDNVCEREAPMTSLMSGTS
jgi:hypothetical protein